jgi:uncharacterized delta-60 repeat protein
MKKLHFIAPILMIFFHSITFAQIFDTTYSDDGVQTNNIGSGNDFGFASKIQTDGKIVASGISFNGQNYDLVVIRYNTNGTLDTSFSNDGILTKDIGSNSFDRSTIAIQNNGKINIAGTYRNNSAIDFAIIQLNNDGTFDNSFSDDGIQTTDFGGLDEVLCMAIQNDGKILVAGKSTFLLEYPEVSIARYNTNGTSDASFNGDGLFTTNFEQGSVNANSISIKSDGEIILVGEYDDTISNIDVLVLKLTNNGNLDSTFSEDGIQIIDIAGSTDRAFSCALQTNGKIIITGTSIVGLSYDIALLRLSSDGSLDTTFSDDGIQTIDISTSNDYGYSVAIQSDGKILVAGNYLGNSNSTIFVLRTNSDGTLDTSFSGDGILAVNPNIGSNFCNSIISQNDEKFLITGTSFSGTNYDITTMRFNNTTLNFQSFTDANSIALYPNPTNDYFSISNLKDIKKIEMFGINGKLIKSFTSCEKYSISDINRGLYYLKIYTNSEKYNLELIVK